MLAIIRSNKILVMVMTIIAVILVMVSVICLINTFEMHTVVAYLFVI